MSVIIASISLAMENPFVSEDVELVNDGDVVPILERFDLRGVVGRCKIKKDGARLNLEANITSNLTVDLKHYEFSYGFRPQGPDRIHILCIGLVFKDGPSVPDKNWRVYPTNYLDVGFTGTSRGMAKAQMNRIFTELTRIKALQWDDEPSPEFHHGDCIGADIETAAFAKELGYIIHSHPPIDPKARGFSGADVEHEPLPYLVRNRIIVLAAAIMLAAPYGDERRWPRSGTWATIRFARRMGKDLRGYMPDGSLIL